MAQTCLNTKLPFLSLRIVALLVTVGITFILAENRSVHATDGKQVALVIGNSDYAVNPITTAVTDAEQVAATLSALGYDVLLRKNLDRERMQNSIATFQNALAGADLGLFFYVGHGVQYQTANYLVPLGTVVESDWQIKETCIDLNATGKKIAQSGVETGVFFIDAAHANPLGTRFFPSQSGLAQIAPPDNLHFFLADAPNRLSRQGAFPLPEKGDISTFTATFSALLKNFPGLSIDQFMQQLQLAITVNSRQERNPWYRMGKNRSLTLFDDLTYFTKTVAEIPPNSSMGEIQTRMMQLFHVPQKVDVTDQSEKPRYPWTNDPILVFHTLLRDVEKIQAIRQMMLSKNIDQSALSALTAKYSYLTENEGAAVTPETLLQRALTRTWVWPDPFLSPELAAKTIAAEKAKEAKALAEETGFENDTAEIENEAEVTKPSLDENQTEVFSPAEEEPTAGDPVEVMNPAIAQFKARLILEGQKDLLKASRLPASMKSAALSDAVQHARNLAIDTVSPATLLEEAMAIYHPQGRMALVIVDGDVDPNTELLITALEESGFVITRSTDSEQWSNDLTHLISKLLPDDVGLMYVTTNQIAINDLLGSLSQSTNALNMIIMDPVFPSEDPKRSIGVFDAPPDNAVILFADTPEVLKKDKVPPSEEISDEDLKLMSPTGPVMAKALATQLDKPGQSLSALFQKVQQDVTKATKAALEPWWIYGIDALTYRFQFNDSAQKFNHLLTQLDLFHYLKSTKAPLTLFEIGWEALVRDHPDWTWFVEKGDLDAVFKRALANDTTGERHTIALKKGLLPRFTNLQGMTFIYHPGGDFFMGSFPDEVGRKEDEAVVEKSIPSGYYLMQTEVTQAQWQEVMGENPTSFDGCGPDCPVETISWYDAQAFIKQLNGAELPQADLLPAAFQRRWREKIEQKPWHVFGDELSRYLQRVGRGDFLYRLPTEAEWEFACRSGRKTMFGFGGELWRLPEYAWYNENAPRSPQPVATKRSNASGFYDLHGNVWEWCLDGQGRFKIVRGGSWYYDALDARCANRYYVKPTDANYNVGLRLVAVPVPAN